MPGNPNTVVDISQVVADSLRHQGRIEATNDSMGKISDEHSASIEREVGAIETEGTLARDIKLLIDSLTIQKEHRNADAAAAFGTNMEASNSIITAMSQSILQQHADLQEAGKEILRKKEIKFSDDPLEFLFGMFTLPREISAYNTREAILTRDAGTLKTLQDLTQEQVKVNNAIAATTTAAISANQAEAALQAAKVRAENARQEAAKFGLQTASVRLATSHQQFETVLQVHNAQVALQHLQLAEASKNINEEMKELQKKNLQLLIDKKEEDAASKALLQGHLDKATALAGMRRITVDEYERAPRGTKEALFDLMANPNTAQGRLGKDTVDALQNVERLNAPLTPALNIIKDKLVKITATTQAKDPAWAALKQDQKDAKFNLAIKDALTAETANIPDTGGFYSAPPLASLRGIPAITSTTLWKSALAPQSNNPMHPTSAQNIYDTAIQLVSTNKMTVEQAATEISQIYKAIAVDNTQQRDYNRFALPLQNDYRTQVNPGLPGISQKVINMTSQSEVLNNMLRSLAAKKSGLQYREESTGSGNL